MIMIDTRLRKSSDESFKKMWGTQVFFNSLCSNSRGIPVLIRDEKELSNIKFENIIAGNLSKLKFSFKDERYLINCLYAPNEDREAKEFFETVFDDNEYGN